MADDTKIIDRLETISAVVLSIAALASSWASYQSGLWDGEQAAKYSQANTLRTEASQAALEGDALATVEIQILDAWLNAKVRGDEALASFYEQRFPPHMRPSFNAWMEQRPLTNSAAAPTPFAMPQYRRPGHERSRQLDKQAEETFARGQYANAVSDAFAQSATILALAMFFGGIGQVYRRPTTKTVIVVMAGAALVLGLLRLISLPVQILGWRPPG